MQRLDISQLTCELYQYCENTMDAEQNHFQMDKTGTEPEPVELLATMPHLVKTFKHIIRILDVLPLPERAAYLIDLGSDTLTSIIKDSNQLGGVLTRLPKTTWKTIINFLGSDALTSIIKDGNQLASMLNLFVGKYWDRVTVINILGIEFFKLTIKDGNQLGSVLSRLPDTEIINVLGVEFLKSTIKDGYQLKSVLRHLSSVKRVTVIKDLGSEALKLIIKDLLQLKLVLNCIDGTHRVAVIKDLGSEALKLIIKDSLQLKHMLLEFLDADRVTVINILGIETLRSIIKDEIQLKLESVFYSLPKLERTIYVTFHRAALLSPLFQFFWVMNTENCNFLSKEIMIFISFLFIKNTTGIFTEEDPKEFAKHFSGKVFQTCHELTKFSIFKPSVDNIANILEPKVNLQNEILVPTTSMDSALIATIKSNHG